MPRYRLTIEYDGRRFCGWQRQPNVVTVQQTIEKALTLLMEEAIVIYGAGRTDTGVHATGQVAHFESSKYFTPFRIMEALNSFMRHKGVCIYHVEEVDASFHARFSATHRAYVYTILNRRPPPVLDAGRVWHMPSTLDMAALTEAASYFIGYHDFSAFRSINCSANNPIRTMDVCQVWQEEEKIFVRVQSRSFLHNQVRIMVGTLIDIAKGRWTPDIIPQLLTHGNRQKSGQTAPPDGLCFVEVGY